MQHHQFVINYISNRYQEPTGNYWYQCVALMKIYAKFVQKKVLWSYNWQANKATYKIWWTYDPRYRHQYNAWPWVDLKQGDHIIQELWKYWHIGILHRADKTWYYMLSQNDGEYHKNTRWNGDWQGNNAIMMRYYRRSDRPILKIYRLK